MRRSHELAAGVVCERCKFVSHKCDYVAIRHLKSKIGSTTGEMVLKDRYNLCSDCYESYMKITKEFLEGK